MPWLYIDSVQPGKSGITDDDANEIAILQSYSLDVSISAAGTVGFVKLEFLVPDVDEWVAGVGLA